jgi:uncharacterized protein
MPRVSRLYVSPIRGLALQSLDEAFLGPGGVAENRRFHLVDAAGRRYHMEHHPQLVRVRADYDPDAERLTLTFPDGTVVDDTVQVDGPITTPFQGGRPVAGHVVVGPWAEALSDYCGRPLRLVRVDRLGDGVSRGRGQVSIVSDDSVAELARRAGVDEVDGRRFRMLVHLAGCEPHEEETWIGRRVRVGEALVSLRGAVARCAITTRDPATGDRDLDTLRLIKSYRGMNAKGQIDFGVYGEVEEPGRVRVGDPVEPLELGRPPALQQSVARQGGTGRRRS